MSKDKSAVRPDVFSITLHSQIQKEAEAKGIDPQDNHLYALSQHKGWLIIKEYIQNQIDNLDTLTATQMSQGATFEDIGRNAVVAQLSKGYLTNILNKVDDAREAVESATGDGGS